MNTVRFRDFHRNVKIRIIVAFAFGIAQATTMPFMAIYFARNFGETLTGLVLAVGIVASVLSGAIGGYYSDRVGRRKIMVWSEGIFFLAYTAMAAGNSPWLNSPTVTLVAFLITNICWGFYGPSEEAMLLDVTNPENRSLMYAIMYWLNNLTMAIGTAIGALLFETARFQLFAVLSIVVFGAGMTTLFLIEETYTPSAAARAAVSPLTGIVRSYRRVLGDRIFVRYLLAGLLTMYGEFQMQNYIGIHLAKTVPLQTLFHLPHFVLRVDGVKLLGWLQTENTILVVLLATIAARLTAGKSERAVLFISIFLQTLGYSVITVVSLPLVAIGAMVFATIGEVTGVSLRQSYLGDIAPESARSAYVAVNGMTFQATRLITSLAVVLGAVVPAWGMGVLCMLLGLLGLWLFQSIVPGVRHRREDVYGQAGQSSLSV